MKIGYVEPEFGHKAMRLALTLHGNVPGHV